MGNGGSIDVKNHYEKWDGQKVKGDKGYAGVITEITDNNFKDILITGVTFLSVGN